MKLPLKMKEFHWQWVSFSWDDFCFDLILCLFLFTCAGAFLVPVLFTVLLGHLQCCSIREFQPPRSDRSQRPTVYHHQGSIPGMWDHSHPSLIELHSCYFSYISHFSVSAKVLQIYNVFAINQSSKCYSNLMEKQQFLIFSRNVRQVFVISQRSGM